MTLLSLDPVSETENRAAMGEVEGAHNSSMNELEVERESFRKTAR